MSDDNKPEPRPGEASAQQYVANSNIDAHLIADMLRIESISNEVKAVAALVEKQGEKMEARADRQDAAINQIQSSQVKHNAETCARMDTQDSKMDQLSKEVKKIESWIFAMIGITITGLLTVVVTLFSGVAG